MLRYQQLVRAARREILSNSIETKILLGAHVLACRLRALGQEQIKVERTLKMEQVVRTDLHPTGWADLLGIFWCKHFHASVMWPIHGRYKCRVCFRLYSVPWHQGNQIDARSGLGVAARC
jgi:hypothetical protein